MTGTTLKIIALVAMTVDHMFKILFNQYGLITLFGMDVSSSYILIQVAGVVGRIAFPIFAFSIAEGCKHTRNQTGYLLRLLVVGIISEIPYQLSFNFGQLRFATSNIFFTLLLGAITCMLCSKLMAKYTYWMFIPILVIMIVIAELLGTEYGGAGVIMITIPFVTNRKMFRFVAMSAINTYLYFFVANSIWLFIGATVGTGLIICYNDLRGKNIKWLFYVYYPTHLILFYVFSKIFGTNPTIHT